MKILNEITLSFNVVGELKFTCDIAIVEDQCSEHHWYGRYLVYVPKGEDPIMEEGVMLTLHYQVSEAWIRIEATKIAIADVKLVLRKQHKKENARRISRRVFGEKFFRKNENEKAAPLNGEKGAAPRCQWQRPTS